MAKATIGKAALGDLIAAVRKDGSFYAPAREGADVFLREVTSADEMTLVYSNFKLPVKLHFFPRCEKIAAYEGDEVSGAGLCEGKSVIFGVRPCDALSLVCLDKVFLDEQFADPYYRARRENSVIIVLACADPLPTCFCTSVGTRPAGTDGADIMTYDVGDALLAEAVTAKGEAFMEEHSGLFGKPTERETKAAGEQAAAAEKKVPAVEVSGITERLQENFDSPVWEEIARRCLGCGVCTYSCPTCHCFGLYDDEAKSGSGRVRAQDSCMFASFTLEASGHNPRPSTTERMRQRIMHKFRYTVENFGDIFCVGCGRCVTNCPVNMDVRETVAEVSK